MAEEEGLIGDGDQRHGNRACQRDRVVCRPWSVALEPCAVEGIMDEGGDMGTARKLASFSMRTIFDAR